MESSSRGPAILGRVQAERLQVRLDRTRDALLAVARELSPEELDWRPDEGVPSAANHLLHVASLEESLVGRILGGRSVRRRLDAEFGPLPARDLDWYLERLGGVRTLTRSWLGQATDEDLEQPRPQCGPWGDTADDLLQFLTHHDVHHRSAIISLRKLIDPGRIFPDLA